MSNRPDGHKKVKFKLVVKSARRYVLLNVVFLGLESRFDQWRGALVDRLCDLAHKFPLVGRTTKTLVLCMYWLRSIFTRIHSAMVDNMATLEPDQHQGEVEACQWCRMGLHHKCERKTRLHALCVCDCERGY